MFNPAEKIAADLVCRVLVATHPMSNFESYVSRWLVQYLRMNLSFRNHFGRVIVVFCIHCVLKHLRDIIKFMREAYMVLQSITIEPNVLRQDGELCWALEGRRECLSEDAGVLDRNMKA